MGFSPTIRRRVRERAAFRCCWCEKFGLVESHHIVPRKEGGPNTEDNAAPLCGECHAQLGGNPDLRPRIRERREWWYKVAAARYGYPAKPHRRLEAIDAALFALADGDNQRALTALRGSMERYVHELMATLTAETARTMAAAVVDGVPLSTGDFLPTTMIAAQGLCECERSACVGRASRQYCFWSKDLSKWVIEKRLYRACYDEPVRCKRCRGRHKRGLIGAAGVCGKPYTAAETRSRRRLRGSD